MHSFHVLSIALTLGIAAARLGPSVDTKAGQVHGGTCSGTSSANYFRGIPYAQPPTGRRRFKPPQPYSSKYPGGGWNATQPAPACVQFASEFREPAPTDEDCLFIDIWTPANASECKDLPVRVWLYGGFNQDGGISDPMYDGCSVAANGAIMVSINYRLGPLGFFAIEKAGFGGNQGIQDALLGLQWVQDNIAAFGGDPRKVLLHGQSAGAIDAFSIATLPQAPRLFSSAIYESGGGRLLTLQSAVEEISAQYAQHLNCSVKSEACLQTVSVSELQSTYNSLPLLNTYALPPLSVSNVSTPAFNPSVDGKVIPSQPNRLPARVPSIFGSNTLEGTLFALASFATSGGPGAATAADYDQFLQQNFGLDAATIARYYPLSAFNATPYPPFYALSTVFTHAEFMCPSRRGVERTVAAGVPGWVYLFGHNSKCTWSEDIPADTLSLLGPTHSAEIPYVLGHTTHLPPPNGTCNMTADEVQLSQFMLTAWSSMAATQRPAAEAQWPAWTTQAQSRGINIIDSAVPGYVNYTVCELWDALDKKNNQ